MDLEEGAYNWNGHKGEEEGTALAEEGMWPESRGTEPGMSWASLGSRGKLSLPEKRVL